MAVIDLTGKSTPNVDLRQFTQDLISLLAPGHMRNAQAQEAMRAQFLQHPELLAQASRNGTVNDEVMRRLGITPELVQQATTLFPETASERENRVLLKSGGIEKRVAAGNAQADAAIPQAEVQRRGSQAALDVNLPEKSVLDQLGEIGQHELERQYQGEDLQFKREELQKYKDFVATLPKNEQERAVTALINPGLLGDERQRQSLDLQRESLGLQREELNLRKQQYQQSLAKGGTEELVKRFELKNGYLSEFEDIEHRLKDSKIQPGEREVLAKRYNALSDEYLQLFPNDPVPIADTVERIFGSGAKDVQFHTVEGHGLLVNAAAAAIASGRKTVEELMKNPNVTPEEQQEVLNLAAQLKQRSQKPFQQRWLELMQSATPQQFVAPTGQNLVPQNPVY